MGEVLIVLDAGPLVAFASRNDPLHARVREFLEAADEPLVLSPFVLAEVDYLVGRWSGIDAELAVLEDVSTGVFTLDMFSTEDVLQCRGVIERYRDLDIGLADASIVFLAHRYETDRVLTLDRRHFRAMRTLDGRPFVILPEDEQ